MPAPIHGAMKQTPVTSDRCLVPAEQRQLKELIRRHGERKVRERLGVGKAPLARLVAGLKVLRSTTAVARVGMASFLKEAGS